MEISEHKNDTDRTMAIYTYNENLLWLASVLATCKRQRSGQTEDTSANNEDFRHEMQAA